MRKISVFIFGILIAVCGSAEASTLSIATNAATIASALRAAIFNQPAQPVTIIITGRKLASNVPTETDSGGIVVALGSPDQGILRSGFRLVWPMSGPNGARFTTYFNANVQFANISSIRPQASTSLTWVGGMGGTPNAWNQSLNWSPNGIPSGSDFTANFDNTSTVRTVNVNAPASTPVTAVTIGSIVFASNSPAYTFNTTGVLVTDPASLTISGAGIENNSSAVQTFNAANTSGGSPTYGRIVFSGDATISGPITLNANGSYSETGGPIPPFDAEVVFTDNSSAGSNQTTINIAGGLGAVLFQDDASAGSAIINDNNPGGYTFFIGNSTADDATLNINRGGLQLSGTATLGDATVNNTTGSFFMQILANATAGNATINNFGPLIFANAATGGTAKIIQSSGTTNFDAGSVWWTLSA